MIVLSRPLTPAGLLLQKLQASATDEMERRQASYIRREAALVARIEDMEAQAAAGKCAVLQGSTPIPDMK